MSQFPYYNPSDLPIRPSLHLSCHSSHIIILQICLSDPVYIYHVTILTLQSFRLAYQTQFTSIMSQFPYYNPSDLPIRPSLHLSCHISHTIILQICLSGPVLIYHVTVHILQSFRLTYQTQFTFIMSQFRHYNPSDLPIRPSLHLSCHSSHTIILQSP